MPATPLSIGASRYINRRNVSGGEAVVQCAPQFVSGGPTPTAVIPPHRLQVVTFLRFVCGQFGVLLPGDAVDEARKGTVLPESGAVVGESIYYSHEHIVLCGGRGSIAQAPGPGSDISHRAIWGHSEFIRPQPPSVDADPPSQSCRGASRRGLRPRGGSCTSLRDAHRPPRVGVSPATSRHIPHHGQSARVTACAAKHANTAAEPRNPTELKPPRAP